MKIRSLTISGMHNTARKTYSFEDLNYLYGPNGVGKSTVLQAIQLAILGYVPGTAKTVSNIFKHANGPQMQIRLDLDDGKYIERTWKVKGRSIDTNVTSNVADKPDDIPQIVGDLELPVFNFSELMNLSANKLKDWFINFLPNASGDIDWSKELKDSFNGLSIMDDTLMDQTLESIESLSESCSSTIEIIQRLNEMFKEDQAYQKTELKRIDGAIQSLVFYDEEDLQGSEEELNEIVAKARQQIKNLTLDRDAFVKGMQIIQSNTNIRNQIASLPEAVDTNSLRDQYNKLMTKCADIQSDTQKIDVEIQQMMQKGYQLDADVKSKQTVINGKGICPYTQCECASIKDLVDQMKSDVDSMISEKKELQAKITDKQTIVQNKKSELSKLQLQMNQLNSQIMQATNNESTRTRLESLLAAKPEIDQSKSLNYFTEVIGELNTKISKVEANKQYSKLIDTFTAEKYKIENTIEVYKSWIKLTDPNGLQTKIMDQPFENLAVEMNQYLTTMFADPDIECKFNLESKANSFSLGITRNGKYIPYDLLSSGEKTTYTLAMLLCIINKSSSELKLLIADDMLDHLDDLRADNVFDAISRVSGIQIIAAGVKDSDRCKSYRIDITQ